MLLRAGLRYVGTCKQARQQSRRQRAWLQLEIPPGLGLDCERYKWAQSQSHVEVFFRLPDHVQPRQARGLYNSCTFAIDVPVLAYTGQG